MTKVKFNRLMDKAIEESSKGQIGMELNCKIMNHLGKQFKDDFQHVFSFDSYSNYLPICFGILFTSDMSQEDWLAKVLHIRMLALELYRHQSLEYGYYKELK
jgi:hypothetical protein